MSDTSMYIVGGLMLVSGAFGWALCRAAGNGDAGRRYVEEHPSAAHEAEETAWDLAAEHCSCRDCKARGSLQCDECSPPRPEDAP